MFKYLFILKENKLINSVAYACELVKIDWILEKQNAITRELKQGFVLGEKKKYVIYIA
jgi:hypothetical protein